MTPSINTLQSDKLSSSCISLSAIWVLTVITTAFLVTAAFADNTKAQPDVLLPGVISTNRHHEFLDYIDITGDLIIFTRASLNYDQSEIHLSWRGKCRWESGKASFSNSGYDADPAFSPGGSTVIFTSTRSPDPDLPKNWNLWKLRADLTGDKSQFGTTALLPSPVNSADSECCAVYLSENSFLFSSDRNGNWDIYQATEVNGKFQVNPLPGAVNTEHGEWPNQFLQQSNTLLFSSIRPDGTGGDDIYTSSLINGEFMAPEILPPPVNSTKYEDNALWHAGKLYWSSRNNPLSNEHNEANIISIDIDQSSLTGPQAEKR